MGGAHVQSVVHLDLNFVIVLFLTAIVRSERILLLSKSQEDIKIRRDRVQPEQKNMILGNDKEMVQGLKTT